jgi:hypothetical protein
MSYVTTEVKTRPCIVCNQASLIELELDRVERWIAGEHVQNVWPEMSPGEREMLITGTHPKCWDSIFEDDLEEEE